MQGTTGRNAQSDHSAERVIYRHVGSETSGNIQRRRKSVKSHALIWFRLIAISIGRSNEHYIGNR